MLTLFSMTYSPLLAQASTFCGFVQVGSPTSLGSNQYTAPIQLNFSDANCFFDFEMDISISGVSAAQANISVTIPSGVDLTASVNAFTGAISLDNSNTSATINNGTIATVTFTVPAGQCIIFNITQASGFTCGLNPCSGPAIAPATSLCNGPVTVSGDLYNPFSPGAALPAITVRTELFNPFGMNIYDGTTNGTIVPDNDYTTTTIPSSQITLPGRTLVRKASEVGSPYVDDLCGVSTADIVKINRLILALENMDGKQRIAADADQNESINVLDVVKIRREILGLEIGNLDLQLAFPTPIDLVLLDMETISSNDASATYEYPYAPLGMGRAGIDFAAIKLGDVTGTPCNIINNPGFNGVAVAENNTHLPTKTLLIRSKKSRLTAGERTRVSLVVPNFQPTATLGLELNVDESVSIEGIRSHQLIRDQENANFDPGNGNLKLLLHGLETTDWKTGELKLVELELVALSDVENIQSLFSQPTTPLENRYYAPNGEPFDIRFQSSTVNSGTPGVSTGHGVFLFPNPVNDRINIDLKDSYAEGSAIVELFDLQGRVVQSFAVNFVGGKAAVNLAELKTGTYLLRASSATGLLQTAKINKL
jgi:hypothetical protein